MDVLAGKVAEVSPLQRQGSRDQHFSGGRVGLPDDAITLHHQHGLRQDSEGGGQLLKYSRPSAAWESSVGLRYTTTRHPAWPCAMVSFSSTFA